MLKLLVCLCTIASLLFSVCAPEVRSSKDAGNQSFQWNSCGAWFENEAGHNNTEGGKVRLGSWQTSQENAEVRSNQHAQENSVLLAIVNFSEAEEYQDGTPVENRWSSRSLCAVLKSENLPKEDARESNRRSQHDHKSIQGERRTLLDQEDLFSWRDMMKSSAPVAHIRVKRGKAEEDEASLKNRRSKYFQQLADSFPRNADKQTAALLKNSLSESADDFFTESGGSLKGDRIVRSVRHKSNRDKINPSKIAPQKNEQDHVKKVYNKKHRKKKKEATKNRARHSHQINAHDNLNQHVREKLGKKMARFRRKTGSVNARASNSTSADDLLETIELRMKRNEESFRNKRQNVEYYQLTEEPVSTNELFPGQKTSQRSNENPQYNNEVLQSAEEVEYLAKELVAKVGVLESYLHYNPITSNERSPDIPAIADLCSNVTANYLPKDPPKAANHCETTSPIATKTAIKRSPSPKKKSRNKQPRKKSPKSKNVPNKHSPHVNKRRDVKKTGRKWGRWTDWSSCSVSCGKGRQIRWRYCLHDCEIAETEMDEKACQLPACSPGKLFGIF